MPVQGPHGLVLGLELEIFSRQMDINIILHTYPVIAGFALQKSLLHRLSSSNPHSTTTAQTAGLKPLSEALPVAFCKRRVVTIMASSATTHLAGSLHFFMDGGGWAFFLTVKILNVLGMLLHRVDWSKSRRQWSQHDITHDTGQEGHYVSVCRCWYLIQ